MKKLSADVCSVTHPGRVRKENEDNYSLNGKTTANGGLNKGSAYVQKMSEPFHLAVCDGMGGESFGELASDIAVNTISKYASENEQLTRQSESGLLLLLFLLYRLNLYVSDSATQEFIAIRPVFSNR